MGTGPAGGSAVAVTCTCELLPGSWALEGRLGLLTGGPETQDSGWSAPQASDRPPPPAADVTVFRPSSFFILVQTGPWLQLQVQLVPLMQAFLWLDPAYRGQMCGEADGGLEADGQPGWGRSLGGSCSRDSGDPGPGQWLGG